MIFVWYVDTKSFLFALNFSFNRAGRCGCPKKSFPQIRRGTWESLRLPLRRLFLVLKAAFTPQKILLELFYSKQWKSSKNSVKTEKLKTIFLWRQEMPSQEESSSISKSYKTLWIIIRFQLKFTHLPPQPRELMALTQAYDQLSIYQISICVFWM